jgi:hypothetical protein
MEKPHSKLGIASLLIGVLTIAFAFFWCLLNYFFFEQIFGTRKVSGPASFLMASLTLTVIGSLFHIVGGILGIIGWRSAKTHVFFSIIGTVFNFLLIILDILLIIFLFFIFVIITAPVH